MRARTTVAAAAVLAAGLGAGATWAVDRGSPDDHPTIDPSSAAATSFPGLTPATGNPTLAGLNRRHPAVGTVATVAGPFDDRFHFLRLRLSGDQVAGAVNVTSDVSEIIDLEVLAGFYDRSGRLLATSRFVHHVDGSHEDEGRPDEGLPFRIQAPARVRGEVASAAVGVPVLVNE